MLTMNKCYVLGILRLAGVKTIMNQCQLFCRDWEIEIIVIGIVPLILMELYIAHMH